jgi:hypothetical protein
MKPKGHKRGCRCVVCSPRKNTRRKRKRNAGYERQADVALWNRADRAGDRLNVVPNSTVIIPGTNRSAVAKRKLGLLADARTRRAGVRARNRNPGGADRELADKLVLFAENTGELYPMIQATQKTLMTRRARGDFDILKAGKAWMKVMNRAAQLYIKEIGGPRRHGSYGPFSPATRSAAAGQMMSHFSTQAATGELDYLLPKKYQRNPVSHFPRTGRGPKGNVKWYIIDLRDGRGNLISSRYRKCARAKCATEAAQLVDRKVGKKMVRKVELSGPYSRKPTASTTRK